MYETIELRLDERVAIITLNQPQTLNAISLKMSDEFPLALKEAEDNPDIRVIVVEGAADVRSPRATTLPKRPKAPATRLRHGPSGSTTISNSPCRSWRCKKPTLAAIEGYCLAGGMEFAGMFDIRYCSEDSRFGVVDTRFSTGVATLILPWIVGPQCREHHLYRRHVRCRAGVERLGFVTRVFPKETLEAEVIKIAKRMSMVAADCLSWNRQAINQTFEIMGLIARSRPASTPRHCSIQWKHPSSAQFDLIKREQGMKAQCSWRAAIQTIRVTKPSH